MGSIKDPRTTDFAASRSREQARERTPVTLDCPPDVAVSFLAKLYSASPELHAESPSLERAVPESSPPSKDRPR